MTISCFHLTVILTQLTAPLEAGDRVSFSRLYTNTARLAELLASPVPALTASLPWSNVTAAWRELSEGLLVVMATGWTPSTTWVKRLSLTQ